MRTRTRCSQCASRLNAHKIRGTEKSTEKKGGSAYSAIKVSSIMIPT